MFSIVTKQIMEQSIFECTMMSYWKKTVLPSGKIYLSIRKQPHMPSESILSDENKKNE